MSQLCLRQGKKPHTPCVPWDTNPHMSCMASAWKNKGWFYGGFLLPCKRKRECCSMQCIWSPGSRMAAICSLNTSDYFCRPGRLLGKRTCLKLEILMFFLLSVSGIYTCVSLFAFLWCPTYLRVLPRYHCWVLRKEGDGRTETQRDEQSWYYNWPY